MKKTRLNIVSKSTLAIVAMLGASCRGGGHLKSRQTPLR